MEAGIFGLFGLLLGFAFAGATSRLDARRQLIVQEANAIGTAYLRLDLLPPSDQPELRRLFRNYLEARFRAYERGADQEMVDRFIAQAAQLQQQIWAQAVAAGHVDQTQNTTRVALPAINEMIDVTTARSVAARTRLPGPVLALLFVVALFSALTAGYAMAKRKRRSVLHDLLYAAAVTITASASNSSPADDVQKESRDSNQSIASVIVNTSKRIHISAGASVRTSPFLFSTS
jgi:hypothetical protein